MPTLKKPYPPIGRFDHGLLPVSKLHTLYYEQVGNPKGKPVIFLHGGPGTGIAPRHRRLFNPKKYRVILFDQRGAGQSTPHSEVKENTTDLLVEDIESLRQHLGIKKWLVVGGSWGSTLGLSYAAKYPNRVTGLVLWSIFLGTKEEWRWIFQRGASEYFPEAWDRFTAPIPPSERNDLIQAYRRRLFTPGKPFDAKLARGWDAWENAIMYFHPRKEAKLTKQDLLRAVAVGRIENHYASHNSFLPAAGALSKIGRTRSIPGVILQGRYDMACRPAAAWKLHKAWPKSKLRMVNNAGHASKEPEYANAVLRAIDEFTA